MMSQQRWTTLTCEIGRSARQRGSCRGPGSTVARPVLGSDNHDASPGMATPPSTCPEELRRPSRISGTSLLVCGTISMAANLVGWLV